jgi:hypothetical protein
MSGGGAQAVPPREVLARRAACGSRGSPTPTANGLRSAAEDLGELWLDRTLMRVARSRRRAQDERYLAHAVGVLGFFPRGSSSPRPDIVERAGEPGQDLRRCDRHVVRAAQICSSLRSLRSALYEPHSSRFNSRRPTWTSRDTHHDTGATRLYQGQIVAFEWQSAHERSSRARTSAGTAAFAWTDRAGLVSGLVLDTGIACARMSPSSKPQSTRRSQALMHLLSGGWFCSPVGADDSL